MSIIVLMTSEEKALLGNPKSIFDEQGFYLYRNERLISWGSWMHMGIRSELNKLARIQVDIPSTLDSVWMLDVKKSSAKIPDRIKDRIKIQYRNINIFNCSEHCNISYEKGKRKPNIY